MKHTLCILGLALAAASGCARTDSAQSDNRTSDGPASQIPGRPAASARQSVGVADRQSQSDGGVPAADRRPPDQVVNLTGCLEGSEAEVPARTSSPRSSAPPPAAGGAAETAGANRFVLRDAKPEPGGGGVGANGAGASGGPLVGSESDYVLDGRTEELRRNVNHEVRISARLSPRDTAAEQRALSSAANAPGNTGAGAPSNGGAPPAAPNANADRPTDSPAAPLRRLMVESVQSVANNCTSR